MDRTPARGRSQFPVGSAVVEFVTGDITLQELDAIVNAANSRLAGGGGVDGAIHRAAGQSVMEECRRIGGCPTGAAVATGAGRLSARHVIHAVGPIWQGGGQNEAALLASAYRRSLEVAQGLGDRSIAFPSISTGAYRFPIADAARIAISAVRDHLLGAGEGIDLVRFVLFSETDHSIYLGVARELIGSHAQPPGRP